MDVVNSICHRPSLPCEASFIFSHCTIQNLPSRGVGRWLLPQRKWSQWWLLMVENGTPLLTTEDCSEHLASMFGTCSSYRTLDTHTWTMVSISKHVKMLEFKTACWVRGGDNHSLTWSRLKMIEVVLFLAASSAIRMVASLLSLVITNPDQCPCLGLAL